MDIFDVDAIDDNLFKMADRIDLPIIVGEDEESLKDVASLMRLAGQAIRGYKSDEGVIAEYKNPEVDMDSLGDKLH